ncbi:hypothetical protein EXW31_29885 (plasmid) [Bacillus mycoides]|nr:hypothetical protein EXW30_29660 [Bacillus mycoides]QWG48330.1 hypothetical protein EXW31_29885 [Bacillus mycoides]
MQVPSILEVEMSLIGFTPHHNQAKKSKYPKTRKLASPGEKVQFFILGCYKIFKLMDMGYRQHLGKKPR